MVFRFFYLFLMENIQYKIILKMKAISKNSARVIFNFLNGNLGDGLWVFSGEYEKDGEDYGEPLFTTIDTEDGFPE